MGIIDDIKVFFGGDRPAPSDEEKKKALEDTLKRQAKPVSDSLDTLLAGTELAGKTNYTKQRVASAIKKAVEEELKKDAPDAEALKKAIIKAVDDTLPMPEPTNDDMREQYKQDRRLLETNAGDLARKLVDLKRIQPTKAIELFNKQMGAVTPMFPVSNAALIGGGAGAALALASDDAIGNWHSLKGIAIKLGLIATGLGVGAFIGGDLSTSVFTGPAKKEDSKTSGRA